MDAWLDKYRETFGEQFPLMLCRHLDENEIIETIKNCIDSGEAYDPDLDDDANY